MQPHKLGVGQFLGRNKTDLLRGVDLDIHGGIVLEDLADVFLQGLLGRRTGKQEPPAGKAVSCGPVVENAGAVYGHLFQIGRGVVLGAAGADAENAALLRKVLYRLPVDLRHSGG